jgi:hypothetical protein
MELNDQLQTLVTLPLRKSPPNGYHWIGPKAALDKVVKRKISGLLGI